MMPKVLFLATGWEMNRLEPLVGEGIQEFCFKKLDIHVEM